jgi:aryl-alcohol dehydrogenase-like predicted oxidoreductase
LVKYNLLDQRKANSEIARVKQEGKGVVAVHVLAGGALGGRKSHPYGHRIDLLRCLVKPGRSLAQAAVQFVLANESVSAAMVRVSTAAHLEEIVAAPEATPLTGRDLEQIFELWANRFE